MCRRLLYLQVYSNSIELRDRKSGRSLVAQSSEPFSSRRLLIGNFDAAVELLDACRRTLLPRFILGTYDVLIHPRALVDGGLSQVERQVLLHVGKEGLGATRAKIYQGEPLDVSQLAAFRFDVGARQFLRFTRPAI